MMYLTHYLLSLFLLHKILILIHTIHRPYAAILLRALVLTKFSSYQTSS